MPGPVDLDQLKKPDETLDELRVGGVSILQKKDGYRFSLDPVLLVAFARLREGDAVADLGTGAGIIPLLVAGKCRGRILGLEIQPDLSDRARRSVLLNGLEGRVDIVQGDVRRPPRNLEQSFDVVFANPPYRRSGTGRRAPVAERAAARHEMAGDIGDFLRAAALLLKNGGRFCVIFLAERLAELLAGMREARLEPKRLRTVHSRQGEEARMVLVEGRKGAGGGLVIMPPLYVYEGDRYTEEVQGIYEGEKDKGKRIKEEG